MEKIAILIIDDHTLFVETLAIMINHDHRFAAEGWTVAEETLDYIRTKKTEIVLLDMNLGKISGLDLIKAIALLAAYGE